MKAAELPEPAHAGGSPMEWGDGAVCQLDA
jgi:hypothetical protein